MTEPLAELPPPPIAFETDLSPFSDELTAAEAEPMILTTWARAIRIAPCLRDGPPADAVDRETLKDVLRGAILRWVERGAGVVKQQASGEFSQTLALDANLFRPSEIRDLQRICGNVQNEQRATTVSTNNFTSRGSHAPWCNAYFTEGALNPVPGEPVWCTCGADLNNGVPLWDTP